MEQGWAESTTAVFGVCDAADPDKLLGMVGLHDIDLTGDPGGVAEVGYWMSPAGRGRGLMTRAVRLISRGASTSSGSPASPGTPWPATRPRATSPRPTATSSRACCAAGESRRGERLDHWVGGLLAEDLPRTDVR